MANSPNVIIVSEVYAREVGDWCNVVAGKCSVHGKGAEDETECADGAKARDAATEKGIPDDYVATKAEVEAARADLRVEYAKRGRPG